MGTGLRDRDVERMMDIHVATKLRGEGAVQRVVGTGRFSNFVVEVEICLELDGELGWVEGGVTGLG